MYDNLHVLWSSRNYVSSGGGDSILTPRTRCAAAVGRRAGRSIPTAPTRILDAPELVDDYYLNLVSWGMNNILAVALGQCVYLWDASTGGIEHLLTLDGPDRKQRYFRIHHELMWEYGKYFSSTVLLESTESSSVSTMI